MDPDPQGTIAGKVSYSQRGEPIEGAFVMVEGSARAARTDARGRYEIRVEAGTYIVQFTKLGRQSDRRRVKVVGGDTATVNVSLASSGGVGAGEVEGDSPTGTGGEGPGAAAPEQAAAEG